MPELSRGEGGRDEWQPCEGAASLGSRPVAAQGLHAAQAPVLSGCRCTASQSVPSAVRSTV